MSILITLLTLLIILISGGLLFWITQWLEDEHEVGLRAHDGYHAIQDQVVGIVEGGQKVHFSFKGSKVNQFAAIWTGSSPPMTPWLTSPP